MMKSDIYKPDIREQTLLHGISYPTDIELLMLILGSGIKGVDVEKLAGEVNRMLNKSKPEQYVENLMKINGMGKGKALSVAAAMELGRRRNNFKNAKIHVPRDVLPFVQRYSMESREHFICVSLNGGNEIIQVRVVTIGTVNRTLVHPREVFSDALMEKAAAIIVCHNHPSGNTDPSEEDINVTRMLMEAGEILGVELLDHIVFSSNSYFSFMENKLLFED